MENHGARVLRDCQSWSTRVYKVAHVASFHLAVDASSSSASESCFIHDHIMNQWRMLKQQNQWGNRSTGSRPCFKRSWMSCRSKACAASISGLFSLSMARTRRGDDWLRERPHRPPIWAAHAKRQHVQGCLRTADQIRSWKFHVHP